MHIYIYIYVYTYIYKYIHISILMRSRFRVVPPGSRARLALVEVLPASVPSLL